MLLFTPTGLIYEEYLRRDYDNDCWVRAFEMSDSDVEVCPDVWAPWPPITDAGNGQAVDTMEIAGDEPAEVQV